MITEAGGLIGNFTGEADYLFQREVVAGSPKIYGQLVQMLAPYSRVIKQDEQHPAGAAPEGSPEEALAKAVGASEEAPVEADKPKRGAVRIRKADL